MANNKTRSFDLSFDYIKLLTSFNGGYIHQESWSLVGEDAGAGLQGVGH